MGVFDMLNISASALSAERQRAEVTAANLANAETTHTDTGGPYMRKQVVFSATNGSPFHTVFNHLGSSQAPAGSVQLTQVVDDPTPPIQRYEPGNPDANASGYVEYPGHQSSYRDGGPDGGCPRLSVECVGSKRGKANDSGIHRHLEIFVAGSRTMSNVSLGAIQNAYVPSSSAIDSGADGGGLNFGDVLKNAVHSVDKMNDSAAVQVNNLLQGGSGDMNSVMIAVKRQMFLSSS